MSKTEAEENVLAVDTSGDSYAEHLAEVNEQQDVISTDDIVNNQGTLLCKKARILTKKLLVLFCSTNSHALSKTVLNYRNLSIIISCMSVY